MRIWAYKNADEKAHTFSRNKNVKKWTKTDVKWILCKFTFKHSFFQKKKMSQRWRTVGNIVSELTSPRFELLTSRSSDKRVTARPTRSKLEVDEHNSYLWSNHKLFRRLLFVEVSDGVEYSTSEYEYEYRKKLRVRVRVLILKNVLEYEYRKKVRVRVRVLLQV